MTNPKTPWPRLSQPRMQLRNAENIATSIRKLLSCHNKGHLDRDISRVRDDAVRMCDQIVRLCRRGQHVTADEVIDYLHLVEVFMLQLECLLMSFIASRRKHTIG